MIWSLAKKNEASTTTVVNATHDKIHFVNQFFLAFDSWILISCNSFSFCANLAFCCSSSVFDFSVGSFSKMAGLSSKVLLGSE